MGKYERFFSTDGTAALKPGCAPDVAYDQPFVAFRGASSSARQRNAADDHGVGTLRSRARSIVERSEMACSLMTEDFRGVAYNALTSRNVATLSIAGTAVAILAIVFGA